MTFSQDDPAFQIALNAPICPRLLRDDAIVTEGEGWYRTLTPSSTWATDDNEVLFSNLDEQGADAEIERIIGEYQNLGRPMRWCVYPWTRPLDLADRLVSRGATRSNVRALVCDTSLPLQRVEGSEIERVEPDSTEVPWLIRFGFKPVFPYSIYQIDPPSIAG